MSRFFVKPKSDELAQAQAMEQAVGGGEVGDDERLPEEFKQLWQAVAHRGADAVLQMVADQLAETPGRQRQVLITVMAQELGYSRVLRRRSTLTREPLWDVLSVAGYRQLSAAGEEALAMIGRSLRPTQTYLHPMSALATLALWRHSEQEALVAEARQRLTEHALPDEPEWLYEVVEIFLEDGAEYPGEGRSLTALTQLVLDHSFWEIGALLAGLVLVHRYGRWYRPGMAANLIHATDVASRQYPQESRQWIDFLAQATLGGTLQFSWLEEPLRAAIRLAIDDPRRQQVLRDYAQRRPFEADHDRLDELYEPLLAQVSEEDDGSGTAHRRLFEEVRQTVEHNPTRAQNLLELMVLHRDGRRFGGRQARMRRAIDDLGVADEIDRLTCWLVGLYVRNATLVGQAARLVRRTGARIDWETHPFASSADYEVYLVISDYERAFEQLTCKFDGVSLEHADKYAAARIKYFVKKRVDPSGINRLVETLIRPVGWLGATLTEWGVVRRAIERGMDHFESRVITQDLHDEVMAEFAEAGVALDDFEAIAKLPVDRIEKVLQSQRRRGLMLGAVAGGISGGLAPFSWGVLSLADIPVMLTITAGLCSRFCWFFGFDPRQYPELPFEILAVALGGTQPAAIEPMLVRQNLHTHMMRNSVVVGAVAHGGMAHLTGRGLARVAQRGAERSAGAHVSRWTRRAVSRNLEQRAVKAVPSRTLPLVGALLGAALNTSLLYDIVEAAQAVLTDRFLERKYPQWARHLSQFEALQLPAETS